MTPNEQLLKEWAMEGGHLNRVKTMSQRNAINTTIEYMDIALSLAEYAKHLMDIPRPNYPHGGQMFKSTNNLYI